MKTVIFNNESVVNNLMQEIVRQAVLDYKRAKKYLEKCKSENCRYCKYKRPIDDECRKGIKIIQEFFCDGLFSVAYPNIDGEWFLKEIDKHDIKINKQENDHENN